MTNRVVMFLGALALVAQGAYLVGCSGGSSSTKVPIMSGTGGAGGGAGAAGMSGSGTCDKGATTAPSIGEVCVDVKSKGTCDKDGIPGTADDLPCWNTCGPNKSGIKNCTCVANAWSCPTCDYDVSDPSKFQCYKTDTSAACPPDSTDTSGNMLPASGGACTQDPCKPCGSASANSYRDSTGVPKMGWCICVPTTDGSGGGVYSCASVKEWAPQCH